MIDLAAMRIAGWHHDATAFRDALIADYDQRLVRAYEEGKREKRNGRPCGCPACAERAVAPPITIERSTS